MRARVRTHTQEKFFLVKEDVLPGIQGGAGHGEGETFRREEHLLQQGALADRKVIEAIHPDMAAGEPVLFRRAAQRQGQLIQGVVEAQLHQGLEGLVDELEIGELLPQGGAGGFGGDFLQPGGGNASALKIGDGLQHGGNEAGVACLPPVEGKPLLHLADGFPHQQSPADLIQRALRQAAAFPEDLFRQAGEAEQGDILLLLPGKEGTDPALHLKGGVLRHQQQDRLPPAGGFFYLAEYLGGFAGTGFAQDHSQHGTGLLSGGWLVESAGMAGRAAAEPPGAARYAPPRRGGAAAPAGGAPPQWAGCTGWWG